MYMYICNVLRESMVCMMSVYLSIYLYIYIYIIHIYTCIYREKKRDMCRVPRHPITNKMQNIIP